MQRVRAGGDAAPVPRTAIRGELTFERLHVRAEDELRPRHHRRHRRVHFGRDGSVLSREIDERNLHGLARPCYTERA